MLSKTSLLSFKRDAQDLTLILSRCLLVEGNVVYYNSRCYTLSRIVFYTCPDFKAPDFCRIFRVAHFKYITCSEGRNKRSSDLHPTYFVSHFPLLLCCVASCWCLDWVPSAQVEDMRDSVVPSILSCSLSCALGLIHRVVWRFGRDLYGWVIF